MDIPFVIQSKTHFFNYIFVDDSINSLILVGKEIGTKANKKWSAFIFATFLFNDDYVTDPRQYSIFLESAT